MNPLGQKGTSGGDACQPDRVLSYEIGLHEAERRTGGGEIWLAAAEHEGAKRKTCGSPKPHWAHLRGQPL